ncbi:MAG: DoxX family protein [Deltaproteobacteria bacterium]|nr:DoxX family protein [Deltaproteobacteria bacterium]MBW2254029.1 DoxX family protein [Deltaproteobacteria bacterium]
MSRLREAYARYITGLNAIQPLFLLGVRAYWGYQFAATGWGKLTHLGGVTDFFTSLGIPFAGANAALVGSTELLGGIALLVGFGGRIAALPLVITMLTAYATAHRPELLGVLSNPDGFLSATPFLFLLASLTVLVFGPGKLSLDALVFRPRQRVPSGDATLVAAK